MGSLENGDLCERRLAVGALLEEEEEGAETVVLRFRSCRVEGGGALGGD